MSLTSRLSPRGSLANSEISLLSSLSIYFCSVFFAKIDGFFPNYSLTEIFLLIGLSNLGFDFGLPPLFIDSS